MSKKKEIKALKESIKHWERMRDDPECGEYLGSSDCACCKMCGHMDDGGINFTLADCDLCPIKRYTGNDSCYGSPYVIAAEYYENRGPSSKMFKRWAQKEIDFLHTVLEGVK